MRHRRLVIAITALLLAILVWRTRAWEAGPLLAAADPLPLAAALALNLALMALWGLRSRLLLDAAGHRLGWLELSLIGTFANLANAVTPASTGEALRALLLRDRHGIPLPTGVAVILIERFYALALIVLAAAAALAVTAGRLDVAPAALAWAAAVALAALPALIYRTRFRLGRLLAALRLTHPHRPAPVRRVASGLVEAEETMAGLLRRPAIVAGFLATTFPTLAVFTAQLWLVLAALGAPVPFVVAWAAMGTGMLAGILSALPFGLGAADLVGAGILLGVGAGIDATVAGTAFLLVRIVGTLPIGLAGGLASLALTQRPLMRRS